MFFSEIIYFYYGLVLIVYDISQFCYSVCHIHLPSYDTRWKHKSQLMLKTGSSGSFSGLDQRASVVEGLTAALLRPAGRTAGHIGTAGHIIRKTGNIIHSKRQDRLNGN